MSHSLRHVRLGRCQRRLVQPGQNMATAPSGGTTSRNLSSLGSTFNGSVTFNQWMPSLGQARGKNPGGLLGFPELTHHTGFADMERECRRNSERLVNEALSTPEEGRTRMVARIFDDLRYRHYSIKPICFLLSGISVQKLVFHFINTKFYVFIKNLCVHLLCL